MKRTLQLKDYPPAIRNASSLVNDVRLGNSEAIDTTILGHVRLVIVTVNNYVRTYNCGHLGDEMDSAALEALTVAVNNVAQGKMEGHDNITGYIILFVRNALYNCLRGSNVVYFPRGQEMKTILPLTENESKRRDPTDLRDELAVICKNEVEELILESRIQGYNDSEIAEILGLSRLMVQRIRNKMKTRFEEREQHELG